MLLRGGLLPEDTLYQMNIFSHFYDRHWLSIVSYSNPTSIGDIYLYNASCWIPLLVLSSVYEYLVIEFEECWNVSNFFENHLSLRADYPSLSLYLLHATEKEVWLEEHLLPRELLFHWIKFKDGELLIIIAYTKE